MKRCPLIDFSLSPDPAALALDNALNSRQPDSRSREIVRRVQALKGPE
jgi:hypothetical protein